MLWHKKIFVVTLLALLLGQPLAAAGTPSAQADCWVKVDPRVQQQIAQADEAEFLVLLGEQADVSLAEGLATKEEKGEYVYHSLRETAERTQRDIRAYLDRQGIPYRAYAIVNLVWVQAADREVLLDLAGRPEVERILPNPHVQGFSDPAGPVDWENAVDAVEWNIAQVHAPEVWSIGYTGQGAVVAGNDTGIQWDHPALVNQYRPQYPGYGRHDYNWHDAINNQVVPYDGHSHGTHTLGTIVGDDGGSNQIGMAPGAQWIGCKNMTDSGVGSPASYIECFEFLLAPYPWTSTPPGTGDPTKAPHVINNSWSCPPYEGCSQDTLEMAVDNLRAAGIEVVVSAGNEGSSCGSVAEPPAIYQQSFSVGATNSSDNIASFSSRGPTTYDGDTYLKPEISAPGVSVRSSMPGGGYGPMSGTSMAAPHVAGLVALLISANPTLAGNPDALEQVITGTAVPKIDGQCGDPNPPNNVYGWGIIDALAAVEAVLPQGGIQGTVTDVETGAWIENAAIDLESTEGAIYQVHTDSSGYYTSTLQPGTYTVTASAYGYVPVTLTGLVVPTDTVITQDLDLLSAVVFSPDPLHEFVFWQSSYSTSAAIDNRMDDPYDFEFSEIPGGAITGSYGLSAAWPGPDGYGYTGEDADFAWIDISASGTSVSLEDHDYAGPLGLGFSFPFYGADYSQFYIASNGFVSFGGGSTDYGNDCPLPDANAPDSIVAPMWDDLDPEVGGSIYYESFASCPVGAGSCTVVAYHDVPHHSGSTAGTFEMVLLENGSVLFQYLDGGSEEGSGSTTGIEGANVGADHGLTYACNSASSLVDSLSLCLVYPGSSGCIAGEVPWLGQQPSSGTVPAGGSLNATIQFTATPDVGVDQPGDYYATLVVNGNPNLRIPVTMTVVTQCLPVEIVGVAAEISGCAVAFGPELTGMPPFDYLWYFGDGFTSTAAAPDHDYATSGSYTATLEVWNCGGSGYDSHSFSVTVGCGQPCAPVIGTDYIWEPMTPSLGMHVAFTATAWGGAAPPTPPIFYSWDMGDGTFGEGESISHSYNQGGTYTVVLTATNCGTATATTAHTIAVMSACEPVTQTHFTWVPTPTQVQQVVTFSASAEGTPVITFTWDFGDGITATGTVVAYAYQAVGSYTVTLVATNRCGQDSSSQRVYVHSARPAWQVFLPLVFK